MKKLVIKTVCVTLALVLLVAGAVFGIFALFIPKPLAKSLDRLGWYDSAITFYERQYKKTQSASDLFVLCLKTDAYKDSARAQEYLGEFVSLDNFEDYCLQLDNDKQSQIQGDISTEEFLEGKFVCAVYLNKGIEKAVDSATACVDNGYTFYNPFFMLITDSRIRLKSQDLTAIKDKLIEIKSTLTDTAIIESDIQAIDLLLS